MKEASSNEPNAVSAGKELKTPFPKLSFHDAMEKYGSDKPDLRYTLEMKNVNEIFKNTGFKVLLSIRVFLLLSIFA